MKITEITSEYGKGKLSIALKPLRNAGFISNKHHGCIGAVYTEEEAALISTVVEYHHIMDASWSESCEIAVLRATKDEPEEYRHFLEKNDPLFSIGQELGSWDTYVEKRKTEYLAKLDKYEEFLNIRKDGKIAEYISDKVFVDHEDIYRLMSPGVRLLYELFIKNVNTSFYIKRADLQVSDDTSLGKYIKEAKENAMRLIEQDFAAIEEFFACNDFWDYIAPELEERDKHVIESRYGFNDNRIYSQKEIAENMEKHGFENISISRVQQIEARVLRRIRTQVKNHGIIGIYQLISKLRENRKLYNSADESKDVLLMELESLYAIRENSLRREHQRMHYIEAQGFNVLAENSPQFLLLSEHGLSARTLNCMLRVGVKTLIDATFYTEEQLLQLKNFGIKSLEELKEKLTAVGLQLRG